MKKCNKCEETKSIEMFNMRKTSTDGIATVCKKCENIKRRNDSKSIIGLSRNMFDHMKTRSIERGHYPPTFSLNELRIWLNDNNINELWEEWKKSDFNYWLTPSVDRLNNMNGYYFDNLQLVTWKQNHQNGTISASNNEYGNHKVVSSYTLKGEYVSTYNSITEASITTSISDGDIVSACKMRLKAPGNMQWRYGHSTESIGYAYPNRAIGKYTLDEILIDTYVSSIEAGELNSIDGSFLLKICKSGKQSRGVIYKKLFP